MCNPMKRVKLMYVSAGFHAVSLGNRLCCACFQVVAI